MATKGVELASAYISLNVSTDRVPRQVRDALRGLKDEDIKIDVDADTKGASANMARFRNTQARKSVGVKVHADTKAAHAELVGLRRNIESLGRSDIFRLNVGAAALHALPALAAGFAEVAAAMQQLTQAGLAIPGVMAGAASSVGTLALGLSGIKDAYDAVTKAADEAATSGGDQAAQSRAAVSASNSLRNAIADEAQARKDVARATRDARRELVDLNIEMRGGIISEKRAVLEAQQAREDLAMGRYTDLRDQLLRIEEADQRVIETRARNAETQEQLADANAKGVANSDQVTAANERLTRAQQNVADAHAAVAASAPQATAAQEAAALAMSKLHPEARKLVETLRDLATNQGLSLRNMTQGNLLKGLSDQLINLSGKALPTVEKGLDGISKAWNQNFTEMFAVLGRDENLSLLDRIFGNTAETQSRLTGTIDPLVEAMGTLAATGSDALPRLADGLVGVTERFAEFITKADEEGRLSQWIDDGITGFGHLAETVLNVGKMFTGITSAADGNLLADLNQWTGQWQAWLNSVEGQNTLKSIFAEGKEVFQEWKPILEDLPGLFQGLYQAADKYMGLLLPIIDRITTLMADHPGLVEAAAAAYVVFQGAKVLGALNTLMGSLTGINTMLGTTMPASAGKTGGALSTNLVGPGAAVIAGSWGIGELQKQMDEFFGTNFFSKYGNVPGSAAWLFNGGLANLDLQVPPWLKKILGIDDKPLPPTSPGVPVTPDSIAPAVPGQAPKKPVPGSGTPGQNPLDVFAAQPSGTYGLPAGTNTGGYGTGTADTFPSWVMQIADAFGIKPSTYAGHQESDRNEPGYAPNPQGLNRGIDWSGPPANMQRFADYLATIPGSLEQVIWQNPNTGASTEIAGGRPQPGYFSADLGGHQDHVHTRQASPIPLPPWIQPFDNGGLWQPGQVGINQTGKPEYVLTPQDLDWLRQNGIDPATVMPHSGQGQPPGPVSSANAPWKPPGPMAADAAVAIPSAETGLPVGRTEGFIPAGAGFSGKTGGGLVGGFINLGGEAAKGAIQLAADLGKMAASAAASAGSFGAGAAAGPAAGAGIQIGADMAKRGVDYATEMMNIGVGAISEQLFPFGAPRWLSDVDPTSFMPNMGGGGLFATAAEAIAAGAGPGMADPYAVQHGQSMGAPPGPVPPGAPGAPGPGMAPPPPGAPPKPPGPTTPPPPQNPPPPSPQQDPLGWFKSLGVFDTGGVLQPNSGAVNLSNRPEYVFTQRQWKTMEANASHNASGGNTNYYVSGVDLNESLRELKKVERRHSSPTMRGKAGLG